MDSVVAFRLVCIAGLAFACARLSQKEGSHRRRSRATFRFVLVDASYSIAR